MRKRLLWGLGSAAVVCVLVALWISFREEPAENLHISSEQWREDLRYLARELPKRHASAFHYTPRETFEKSVADLDVQLVHANADQAWVGLQRLVSLIGDAHTYLQTPKDAAGFDIDIARFGDDYRIVDVDPAWKNTIGARVIKIADVPVDRAAALAHELFSRDENPPSAELFVESALTTGAALHGLGITADRDVARYTLLDDSDHEFTVDVGSAPGTGALVRAFKEPPLYMRSSPDRFSCTYLAEASTLYCNVLDVLDLKAPAKAMLETIRQRNPQKLVIDLRRNRGGDYTLGEKYLVHPIRELAIRSREG